jgi:ubiquinone/menaquinone biosynthesis C-methylase UbiE
MGMNSDNDPVGANLDQTTVEGFGREWAAYDQTELSAEEHARLFNEYFAIFPFDDLPSNAEGFDIGCGSGRWAALVVGRVGTLHCIDASAEALKVARKRLEGRSGVRFHHASVDSMPLADASQDFGYSLGVLHHVPDTQAALEACTSKLKPGSPFLLYVYYRFDNRPAWFKALWQASDWARTTISRCPFPVRKALTGFMAATVYWPLARIAALLERRGRDVSNLPLSAYRWRSFYSMRTDALDRFGTALEQRFTRGEIETMMKRAGLEKIRFSDQEPFWVAVGCKAGRPA